MQIISKEDIRKVLILHKKWLEGKSDGVQARFSNIKFQSVVISKCDLTKAVFTNCEFECCVFDESTLVSVIFENNKWNKSMISNSTLNDIRVINNAVRCSYLKNSTVESSNVIGGEFLGFIIMENRFSDIAVRKTVIDKSTCEMFRKYNNVNLENEITFDLRALSIFRGLAGDIKRKNDLNENN